MDSIKEIPLAIPTADQEAHITQKVNSIILQQKEDPDFDYHDIQFQIDLLAYDLYHLTQEQIQEVEEWYARRYPKLRRDIDTEDMEVD